MLVRRQYHTDIDFEISQIIVKNKIINQKKALQSLRNNNDGVELLNNSIIKLDEPIRDLSTLMGIEGTAAKVYFNRMFNTQITYH